MAASVPAPAEPECSRWARDLLAQAGHYPKRIVRVYSAGESGEGCEVILFVTHGRVAKTARVNRPGVQPRIRVSDGFNIA